MKKFTFLLTLLFAFIGEPHTRRMFSKRPMLLLPLIGQKIPLGIKLH